MSQNLISRSRRDRAIALLDETIHAMIDHHRLRGIIRDFQLKKSPIAVQTEGQGASQV
ncbi:hypothetical protein G7B40_023450 [Aetokthonos hydrillicola Thurmond2011]|uniref:Uncharacterized protein n=1 Tax=Aetokthonos hydrillicola Thurmond2011 TaxID=2712845 RepID=A0AAP5M9R7_9CYAN|nr:hypothetical protein [Aetokthonos hydrillicola Thurmond2011]